tara:strand:- start:848 stop:1786 length:939 start_codon:yes stop_codon:yes gene_type:complete
MKKNKLNLIKLNGGTFYHNNSLEVLKNDQFIKKYKGKIDLIFTSPPFPLLTPKKYDNKKGEEYIEWFKEFAEPMGNIINKKGSIVIEIGNSWTPKQPTYSLIELEALLAFKKAGDFHLCQEFIWHNPAKLPGPTEWVNKYKIRVKDTFTKIWWLSKTPNPYANQKDILKEYSEGMVKLLRKKKYNAGKRATGHNISKKGFYKNNKGAIPANVFEDPFDNFIRISNTNNVHKYKSYCEKKKLPMHPARMPELIPEFFIKFLTKNKYKNKKSIVLDPFAGSNTTGYVASKFKRKWIAIEKNLDYIEGSKGWFKN